MTVRIALVSCVKTKLSVPSPAGDLYCSPLFRALRSYAQRNADAWYILSAEYGLVDPAQVIAPYERTLKNMSKQDRVAWSTRVQSRLSQVLPERCEVILLAGERYRDGVETFLKQRGIEVSIPLQGLGFGRQLQWLSRNNNVSTWP